MEMTIGFLFELVKITLLAMGYSALLFFCFWMIAKRNPDSWFVRACSSGGRFLGLSAVLFWMGLFVYMFTYWGFHGLGDGAQIPIGHGLIVDNINWDGYGFVDDIKTSDDKELSTTKFKVVGDKLCGNLDDSFDWFQNAYFTLDTRLKRITEFRTEADYNEFAKQAGLPGSIELESFNRNYDDYWLGWRFWMLP